MKGGKRTGAGRPKGEPTKTVSFRVKVTDVDELIQLVKDWKSTKE